MVGKIFAVVLIVGFAVLLVYESITLGKAIRARLQRRNKKKQKQNAQPQQVVEEEKEEKKESEV